MFIDPKENDMPFTRIAVRNGKPAEYRQALARGVHRALMEVFRAPEDDFFMLVNEHDADNFLFGRHYLGIERSDDLVMIQIAVSNTRGQDQKKALFAQIAFAEPGELNAVNKHLARSRALQQVDIAQER